MKLFHNFKNLNQVILLLLIVAFSNHSFGQGKPKRLSASFALGVPVTFFSVKSKFVGLYTGAVRYSLNKSWSIEAKLTSNTFYNSTGNPPKTALDGTISDVLTYRSQVYGFNGIAYYNFQKLFGLAGNSENRWMPFANFGAGINYYKPTVKFVNGTGLDFKKFGKPYRDWQVGLGARYYLNVNIDLYGGAEYHIAETYYLDGLKEATNPSLDQYLNFYAGVSVKIGAKPWNNLIDWSKKNMEVPTDPTPNYAKWALDVTAGFPYLFSPVGGYKLTGMMGVGLRRSFTKAIALSLNYNAGKFSGGNDNATGVANGSPASTLSYKTSIKQFTGRIHFNLRNLVKEPFGRRDWNHFGTIGIGYIIATGDASFSYGKQDEGVKLYITPGIQNIVLGYEARRYLTNSFDLIAGLDFSYNQSKWLDQSFDKPNLNSHLYVHTGITYKIGASKTKQHIDWTHSTYNNFKYRKKVTPKLPVLEKPTIVDTIVKPAPAAPEVEPELKPEPVVEPKPELKPEPAIEPKPVVEPKPAIAPKPTPVVVPEPVKQPKGQVSNDNTPPPYKYNVVVACYSVDQLNIAKLNQKKLENRGFNTNIFRTSAKSKLLRLSILSTDDKVEALKMARKARKEIDPYIWIYIYNKQ